MNRDEAISAVEEAQEKIEDAIDLLRQVEPFYGGERLCDYIISYLESTVGARSWSRDYNLDDLIKEIEGEEEDDTI